MGAVVDLEAIVVSVPAEGNAFTDTDTEDMLLVIVTDEDGRTGIGECSCAPSVLKALLEFPTEHFWANGIREHVIGKTRLRPGDLRRSTTRASITAAAA